MSDDVLTSSWCTNWAGFNTPRLWAMVSEEDDPDAWRQVAAWAQVAGAVKDHRALLLKARESLTAAWPPETNRSADAFVHELDRLIARMDVAREEADTTATGLANILQALGQAKVDIQPLYERYREKSHDLVPGWWDNAEDEIDEQARAHMITAEQIVQQNVPQLRVPEPYTMDPNARGEYRPDTTARTAGSAGPSSLSPLSVPHDPVPPLPGRAALIPDPWSPSITDSSAHSGPPSGGSAAGVGAVVPGGPGLAGVAPPAPAVPPNAGPLPGVPPVIGGGPVAGPGTAPGPVPAPPPGLVPGQPPGGAAWAMPGGSPATFGGGYAGGRPVQRPVPHGVLPSGAVLGETVAGSGRASAGASAGWAAGGSSGRTQGTASRRPAARPGESTPRRPSWLPDDPPGYTSRSAWAAPAMIGGRRAAGDDPEPAGRYDPDNFWRVASGVDQVIHPRPGNARHDPGPNVIGYRG